LFDDIHQITINADYSGGQSNAYTPQYAEASSAGMFVMKQRNGGEGTVDVYVKASGTDGSTTNISTFTQILALHTNGNVGIGSVTPAARLEVRGKGSTSATTALEVDNSGGTSLLTVRDDGYVKIGTNGTFFSSIIRHSETKNNVSLAGSSNTSVTFTVSGALMGAIVFVSPASEFDHGILIASARVSSANTVTVQIYNDNATRTHTNTYYITVINP
jgi:hypothetical protein